VAKEPYYQFPLCFLQLNISETEHVQNITSYCLIDRGEKLVKGGDVDSMIVAAAEQFGLTAGSGNAIHQHYEGLRQHQRDYERIAGPDVLVRLRSDIIWAGLNKGGLSMREFLVLTGIYAAIGGKTYGPIALDRLRYLAAGYKTKKAYDAVNGWRPGAPLLKKKKATAISLTDAQIKYTRNGLRELKWFASCHDGRRVYYSIKLNNDQLKNAITRRMQMRQKQRGRTV